MNNLQLTNRLLELISFCDETGFLPEKYNAEMLKMMVQYLEAGQELIRKTNESNAKMDEMNHKIDIQMAEKQNLLELFAAFIAAKNLEGDFTQFVNDLTASAVSMDQVN